MAMRDRTSPKAKASVIDPDAPLTDEDEEDEAGPDTPFDDERTEEEALAERCAGYDLVEDDGSEHGTVACICKVWPCIHNNPR
jgi:hypothetical protein